MSGRTALNCRAKPVMAGGLSFGRLHSSQTKAGQAAEEVRQTNQLSPGEAQRDRCCDKRFRVTPWRVKLYINTRGSGLGGKGSQCLHACPLPVIHHAGSGAFEWLALEAKVSGGLVSRGRRECCALGPETRQWWSLLFHHGC